MEVDDRGLGPGGFHLIQIALELGVEFRKLVIGKVVQNAVFAYFVVVQQRIAVLTETIGIGVAHHADLDAVDLFNGPFLFIGGEIGPEGVQSLFTDDVQRPLVAHKGGVVCVVVGGEQHIKARPLQAVHNGIGAVEFWVSGVSVAVVRAAQGGFQVGDGEIRSLGIGFDILENGIEIVAAVILLAGVDDLTVHENIAGGEHCGGRNQLRGFLRWHFRAIRGGRCIGTALRSRGLLIRFCAAGCFQAKPDHNHIRYK